MERKLPVEVLSMIFGEEGENDSRILNFHRNRNLELDGEKLSKGSADIQYETNFKTVACVASRVCLHWLNVVENDRTLLATDVRWWDGHSAHIKRSVKALLKHLDANTPSEINIVCTFSYKRNHEFWKVDFVELFPPSVIANYAHRITTLDINFWDPRGVVLLLGILRRYPLPKLRRLGLKENLTPFPAGFDPLPRLRATLTVLAPPQRRITVLSIDSTSEVQGWGEAFGDSLSVLKMNFNLPRPRSPSWLAFLCELRKCRKLQHLVFKLSSQSLSLEYEDYLSHESITCPELISLTIRCERWNTEAPFWWLLVWAKMPRLEEVVLFGLFVAPVFQQSFDIDVIKQISLPCLRRLSAMQSDSTALQILTYANVPMLNDVFYSDYQTDPRWPTFQPTSRECPATPRLTFNYVHTQVPAYIFGQFLARAYPSTTILTLTGEVMTRLPTKSVQETFRNVRQLAISRSQGVEIDKVNYILDIFPKLETLILSFDDLLGDDAWQFLEKMVPNILPSLKKLVLLCTVKEPGRRKFGKKFVCRLILWIQRRQEGGKPLQNLTLSRGVAGELLMSELKSLVPEVVVSPSIDLMELVSVDLGTVILRAIS